jgi:hypothetical protein
MRAETQQRHGELEQQYHAARDCAKEKEKFHGFSSKRRRKGFSKPQSTCVFVDRS